MQKEFKRYRLPDTVKKEIECYAISNRGGSLNPPAYLRGMWADTAVLPDKTIDAAKTRINNYLSNVKRRNLFKYTAKGMAAASSSSAATHTRLQPLTLKMKKCP